MKKIILICTCLLLFGCTNSNEKPTIQKVTCDEAKELIKNNAILVDVREKEEYDEGHLENAINIPYTEIEKVADHVLTKYDKIILYCRSGRRSNIAAETLINDDYTNIYDLGSIDNCSN